MPRRPRRLDGLPWWSSLPLQPPRAPRPRHRLTAADRQRGGQGRWAQLGPNQRRYYAREAAHARWAKASPEARQRVVAQLIAAKRDRLPMIAVTASWPPGVTQPLPTWWPRDCERCGRPANPYLCEPDRPFGPWAWRCARHARQPRPTRVGMRVPPEWLPYWTRGRGTS